jgi:hypothetical protein
MFSYLVVLNLRAVVRLDSASCEVNLRLSCITVVELSGDPTDQ